jgi:signal transduction histidine kinase
MPEPMAPAQRHAITLPSARVCGWLALLAGLCWMFFAGLVAVFDEGPPGPATQHIVQAEMRTQADGSFAAPARLLDPAVLAGLAGGWLPVELPLRWARTQGPDDAAGDPVPQVTWLQVKLDGLATAASGAGGLVLYLPRWQTIGRIAVYGDDQLLYRSQGDVVWSAFNFPLWVPLDAEGTLPAPAVLRIRIDSLPGAGGNVSSIWVGPAKDLAARYQLRSLLQTGVADVLGMAALGLGAFALAVWLLRRRERTYLLFALFTLLWVLRGLRYHVGMEPLPIPSAWFGWMTINSGNALLVTWYVFVSTLVPTAPRWPIKALLGLLVVSSIVTLPLVADHEWIAALAPLTYLVTIAAGVPANILMAWAAWRHGGREGIVAASIGLLHMPVAVHDWMMQNYLLDAEHLYAWPLSTVARLGMFIYVILSRYVGAADEAEQANARLTQRLSEREAELAASYEQLRAVQQRQMLSRERQRLMQDIHDGMGSQLMSALEVAESGQLSEAQMATVLRECIEDLKLTVDSLEPVEADLLLLLATLRWRLAPRLQGSGLVLRWEVSDVPALDWLDPRSALHVLRILQEAISNILQHAGATELRVATGEAGGGVFVTLDANGGGFAESQVNGGGQSKGLSNMARRALAVGGDVAWQAIDGGSRFRLWLPLERPAEDITAAPAP